MSLSFLFGSWAIKSKSQIAPTFIFVIGAGAFWMTGGWFTKTLTNWVSEATPWVETKAYSTVSICVSFGTQVNNPDFLSTLIPLGP